MSTPSSPSPEAAARRPEDAGRSPPLFVLLHGVGATPASMAPIAERLRAAFPDAPIVAPAGLHPFDGGGAGRQWFSVAGVTEANRPARVAAALPAVIALLRSLQHEHAVDASRTVLVGFSQGAIVALEAVQAEPRLASRVLAFSGRHASLPDHAPAGTRLHLLHGMDDRVMPVQPVREAARRLLDLGADVTLDVLPGVGHEAHPALVDRALAELRQLPP